MLVSRSALEKVSPADRFRRTTSPSRLVTVRSPLLEDDVVQRAGQRRLAAAGQAGEEQHQPLLGRAPGGRRRRRPRPRRAARPRRSTPSTSPGAYAATTRCAQRWSASASPREASGTATTAASASSAGRGQRGADQARRGEALGGAGAGQREQQDRPAGGRVADRVQVLVGQRPGDRDGQRARRRTLGDLGGGEVQPAERRRTRGASAPVTGPVIPVRSPASYVDPTSTRASGQALGVDQLQGTGVLRRGGDVGGHRAA